MSTGVKVIVLIPFGAIQDEVLSSLEVCLWQVFGFEVRRAPSMVEPSSALDQKSRQYFSTVYLKELVKHVPDDAVRVLGITSQDLTIPMLSFVFGHAQVNGRAAVISLARLHQHFYRLPEDQDLFLHRTLKEAVHEIGHTFGLLHCPDPFCAMSLSNAIQQVDHKSEELCANCSILFQDISHQIRRSNGMEMQR